MLVQVRQAHDLLDVDVVHAVEALGALPLAFPVLRIGHRVLDLELLAAVQQPEPLDDAQLLAGGNRGAALIHPVVIAAEVPGVHDQRVAFPTANRFAVERAHDDVGIGVLTAVEEDRCGSCS